MEKAITEVKFERTFNLGNYENVKIGFTATIGPENPDVEKTLTGLDRAAIRWVNAKYPERVGGGRPKEKQFFSKFGPGGEDDND